MVRRQQAADRAVRPKVRSPGHPKFLRHVEVAFWEQIAEGLLPEEAACVAGVAQAVGARWFHNAGGMPPFALDHTPSGRYLCFAEREEIALLKAQDKGVREIARAIGRDPGTVSRELRRNAAVRYGSSGYRASVAQWKADMAARRPKAAKLVANPRLRDYATTRLRPGSSVGAGQPAGRHDDRRADTATFHRPQQTPPQGSAVVAGLEPGADREPDQARLPR